MYVKYYLTNIMILLYIYINTKLNYQILIKLSNYIWRIFSELDERDVTKSKIAFHVNECDEARCNF